MRVAFPSVPIVTSPCIGGSTMNCFAILFPSSLSHTHFSEETAGDKTFVAKVRLCCHIVEPGNYLTGFGRSGVNGRIFTELVETTPGKGIKVRVIIRNRSRQSLGSLKIIASVRVNPLNEHVPDEFAGRWLIVCCHLDIIVALEPANDIRLKDHRGKSVQLLSANGNHNAEVLQ